MDRTVSVTGHAPAIAVPDTAVVRVAVSQDADNVAEAYAAPGESEIAVALQVTWRLEL